MLAIRLQRVGRIHEPKFRVVLTDSKNGPKSGRFIEVLGAYDARIDNKIENIDVDRIKYWISQGAQLSDTLHNFLITKKVLEGKKKNVLPKHTAIKKDAPATTEAAAPVAASPVAPASEPTPAPAV